MIPSCSDLVSLSIDIWTKSEEIDGTRLVVPGDIGTKPLVVNDLQPPPVCRYLKVIQYFQPFKRSNKKKIDFFAFDGVLRVFLHVENVDCGKTTLSGK